jgi:hypothetical protein
MWAKTVVILLILLLTGCKAKEASHVDLSMKPVLKLPPGLQLVKQTSTSTNFVGDVNHPTIDGGIVNMVDGLPLNAVIQAENISYASSSSSDNITPFQDDWATATRVKTLLREASKGGKLAYVLKKTEDYDVPASIAVVPMIESNYQNQAVSNKGAAGAWQLMPSVAKNFDISNEARFHFETSTDVALRLLKQLNQQFQNWELTFAAYNAGSQRVKGALVKNPEAKSIDELDLPEETKKYVKRLKAVNHYLSQGVL